MHICIAEIKSVVASINNGVEQSPLILYCWWSIYKLYISMDWLIPCPCARAPKPTWHKDIMHQKTSHLLCRPCTDQVNSILHSDGSEG